MGWHAVNYTTLQRYSPGHGLFCAVQARTRCHAASLLSCMPVWCVPPRCWAATSWATWRNSGLPSMQERAWSSMHNPEEQVTSQSLWEGAWRKVTHCFGTLQMKSFYTSLNTLQEIWWNSGAQSTRERAPSSMCDPKEWDTSLSLMEDAWRKVMQMDLEL